MSDEIKVTHAGMDQLIDLLQDGVRNITGILRTLDDDVADLRARFTGEASDAYDRAHRDWTSRLDEMNDLLAHHRAHASRAQEIFQGVARKNADLWS
jgi:WXG100 family type VII secretion target